VSAPGPVVGVSFQEGARNRDTCKEFETDFTDSGDNNRRDRANELLSEMTSGAQSYEETHFARYSSQRTTTSSFQQRCTGDSRHTTSFRLSPKCERWLSFGQRVSDNLDTVHCNALAEERLPVDVAFPKASPSNPCDDDDKVVVASSSSLLKFLSKSTSKALPCDTTERTELADGACVTEFTEQRQSFDLTHFKEPCKSMCEMEGPHELTDLMSDDLGLGIGETQGCCAQSHTSGFEEATIPSCSSTKQPCAEDMLPTGAMVELPTTSQVPTHALARPR